MRGPAGETVLARPAQEIAGPPAGDPSSARPGEGRELEEERIALLRSRVKTAFGWGLPLFFCFWFLDTLVAPGLKWRFLEIRCLGALVFAAAILLAHFRTSALLVRAASISGGLACTLTIAAMTFHLSGFSHSYYVGLTVPIYVAALLFPWTLGEVAVFCGVTLAVYLTGNAILLARGVGTVLDAVQAVFFVGIAVLFTVVSVTSHTRTRFSEFRARKDLERANEDLRELDRMKTRFFANVSHELRTPLTLVLSPIEKLLDEARDPAVRKTLEIIFANAVRLLKLINALLDFARLDEGKVKLNLDRHHMGEVVRRVAEAARPFAERRGIRLSCEAPADLPRVWSDLDLIEKVVYNLLSNALKFTPPGGEVTLSARADAERVWVRCRDSGPGIPEAQMGQIFQRFQQTSSASRAAGSGIGLSLARELVRLHRGDIEAESAPGGGTEIRFWLPLVSPLEGRAIDRRRSERRGGGGHDGSGTSPPDPDRPPAASDADGAPSFAERRTGTERRDASQYELPRFLFESNEYGAAGGPARPAPFGLSREGTVLVAEDHGEMREYIRVLLEDRYQVLEAADGREALEAASRLRPDVILADFMMPELDGIELARRIRAEPATSLTPVIIVTARADLSTRLCGLQGGANDFLVKPFHPQELRAKVDSFVRLRRFERELAEKSRSLERSLAELAERETRLAALGRMTSSIVHDLRNPLTAVTGYTELAISSVEERGLDEVGADLRQVLDAARRIGRMVEELLAFARGGARLRIACLRLADVVQAGVAPLAPDLARRRIALEIDLGAAAEAVIEADRDGVSRVLENLIRNSGEAIEARAGPGASGGREGARRGRVRVEGALAGATVTLRVLDDGCGIPSDFRDRLFAPFASAGKAGGTGLGLATARMLVRAHGGDLEAEPEPAGGGAAFRITLPVAEKASAKLATALPV